MNPADPFHIFDGRVLFGTHMDSAIRLQGSETGERLQVIYLIKKDGTQLAYVGPVLQEGELFSVENVEEGEILQINGLEKGSAPPPFCNARRPSAKSTPTT